MVKFSEDNANAWSGLLDELKQKGSYSNDAKLSAALGISRGQLCSIRKGRRNVSLTLAKDIFSRLGRTFDIANFEQLLVPQKVRLYTRDLNSLRKDSISRAKGACQLCGTNAPFKEADGTPFLEVHHIIPLSEEGCNHLNNLVALCPNCHRKIHFAPSIEDKKKLEAIAKKYFLNP